MNNFENLEFFLRKTFNQIPGTGMAPIPANLTIGIEHEFFLMDKNSGLPVTHEQSQAFLKKISEHEGWHIREKVEINGAPMISRVSWEQGQNRFTALKYDHHPHLLEVAFGYRENLWDLENDIRAFWDLGQEVAFLLGIFFHQSANLGIDSSHPRVTSDLPEFVALRSYREKLFEKRGQSPRLTNYAATIAATQTHIGGTRWWERENYVGNLYALEPLVLAHTSSLACGDQPIEKFLQNRWTGYNAVFSGYPLVGFPHLTHWNMKSWCEALLQSPLYGKVREEWAGKSLLELGHSPFDNWKEFFGSVRDLQVIRPRLFGTLEFRADPAQPDLDSIMAVAALRMGLSSWLLLRGSQVDLRPAHQIWWESVTGSQVIRDETILEKAKLGLERRKLHEEKLLAPLIISSIASSSQEAAR